MAKEDLVTAIKLAEDFVYDPDEALVFSGRSLRDILRHLRRELENNEVDEGEILTRWTNNAPTFQKILLASARRGKVVEIGGRKRVLIREEDAATAAQKCPKGPDYHNKKW